MEEGSDLRHWDELIPDALGLIFKNLSLRELLTVVPSVCKSWRKAVTGPYCWQEINIEEYCRRCHPNNIDPMVKLLVTRSGGSLRKLTAYGLGIQDDSIFSFIADHASSLQTLRIPSSEITDPVMEQIAERFSTVTFLDISYCNKLGRFALEAIGRSCKNLKVLCRNMHPIGLTSMTASMEEVQAIGETMPKLKHLELAYQLMEEGSVHEMLKNCPDLEFLDLRGCWNVDLEYRLLKERFPRLKVLGPMVVDNYQGFDWEECSDLSDSSGYLAWEFAADVVGDYYDDDEIFDEMWDDEGRLEELELRFYEAVHGYDGRNGWNPPSP